MTRAQLIEENKMLREVLRSIADMIEDALGEADDGLDEVEV